LSFWSFLNHWWNLPSLVMLGLVGAYFALQTVGLIEHGGDGDAEIDQQIEADAEAEQELEHDADADAETESEHDVEGATGSLASQSFLGTLGFGRVPFMVVALSLLIFAGFSGLFFNRFLFLHFGGAYPAWLFPISLAASLVVGVVVTRFTARFAGKLVDVGGKGSTRRSELPGRLGVVASALIDGEHGEVRVRDERGDELIVHARIEAGRNPVMGEQVVLLAYDEQRGLYSVAPLV
jgi:membrane protein implicated in regulation of membrane protease activity